MDLDATIAKLQRDVKELAERVAALEHPPSSDDAPAPGNEAPAADSSG